MKKFQFFRDEFFTYLKNLTLNDGTVTFTVVEKTFAMAVETTKKKYGEEKKELSDDMELIIQNTVADAFNKLSHQLHKELEYQMQQLKPRPKSPFGP